MRGEQRRVLVCGLASGAWGLIVLLLAFLQPYTEVRNSHDALVLHPGFTSTELPYLIVFGIPFLVIVAGACAVYLRPSRAALTVLWLGTGLLGLEVLVGILSLGIVLLPGFVLGVLAAAFAASGAGRRATT